MRTAGYRIAPVISALRRGFHGSFFNFGRGGGNVRARLMNLHAPRRGAGKGGG